MRKSGLYVLILMMVLVIVIAIDMDLSLYPFPFMKDNEPNSLIVIGDDAAQEDIIGASNIAVVGCPRSMETVGTCKNLIPIKRDNELNSLDNHMIIVGGPCANKIAAQIMDIPATWPKCATGFRKDQANIILLHKYNKTQLIVAGMDARDTRNAAEVLANYKEHNLSGKYLVLSENREEGKLKGIRVEVIN